MMNKKGSTVWHSFISAGFIFALIAFISFFIFGSSGGFQIIYKVGHFLGSLPAWGLAAIVLFILYLVIRK